MSELLPFFGFMYGEPGPPFRPFSVPPPPMGPRFNVVPRMWCVPPMPLNFPTSQPPTGVPSSPPPPLPPAPLGDPIETSLIQWLAENEPRIRARRLQQTNPKIPDFRSKLKRWDCLLKELRTGSDPNLKEELFQLERECSDPATIEKLQLKLRNIRKKRRNQKRRRRMASESAQEFVVCRSAVAETVTRLRSEEHGSPDSLRDQSSGTHVNETKNSERPCSESCPPTQPKQCPEHHTPRLSYAVTQCTELLSLLDGLQRLRAARLNQARQQGGLYPEALDLAFTAQLGELRTSIRTHVSMLQNAIDIRKMPSVSKTNEPMKPPGVDSTSGHESCCNHFPGLLDWKKRLLFCAGLEQRELPWKCKRFYHQADFDFTDFLRIRFAWDAYLVPDAGDKTQSDIESSISEKSEEDSQLPATWIVPPEVSPDSPWAKYLETNN